MKTFVEPLRELTGFAEMTDTAEKQKGLISITGCIDAQKPHMIYAFGEKKRNKVIVTFNEIKAKELYEHKRELIILYLKYLLLFRIVVLF